MTNLGDLNKDGYEDIAIGAPYEGKGAVYIYLGSKNGIIKTPSQVINFLENSLCFILLIYVMLIYLFIIDLMIYLFHLYVVILLHVCYIYCVTDNSR